MTDARMKRIAELNDALRTRNIGGSIMTTVGVVNRFGAQVPALVAAIAAFDGFTPENDPHGEHDFGQTDFRTHDNRLVRVFWKIDYYDPTMEAGSEDPSDPAVTRRCMTIMLASEY